MFPHFHYHCGHHRGGHGSGRFGRGFMGGDMGGRAFGMGRKLASVDLQLLILRLLADKPRHGYEVIKELDERTHGFYVPSPGMVYPALTYLEELGHATVAAEGTRKLYSITDAGGAHLAENRATVDDLLAQFERVGKRMDRVRKALDEDTDGQERARGGRHGSREFQKAREELREAIAPSWDSTKETQERIAGILTRAAEEISKL